MQTAVLVHRDWQGKDFLSGITTPSRMYTHINLNGANDFNGRNASDRCDLLAPFDMEVKAVSRNDNAVFFQSLEKVLTPSGIYDHVWLMCCHMLDSDYKALGIRLGKVFYKGEPCYTEGNKGIGSGYHIHMEQGYGEFGGGSLPYYKSSDVYSYNGKIYSQYYPNVKGAECPVTDIFFLPVGLDMSTLSNAEKTQGHKYYSDLWVYENAISSPIETSFTEEEYQFLLKENEVLRAENEGYKSILGKIREVLA